MVASSPSRSEIVFTECAREGTTPIPDGLADTFFTELFIPAIEGRSVAFRGLGTMGQQGVYECDVVADTLEKRYDTNTLIPDCDGVETFTVLGVASWGGGNVAFNGSGCSNPVSSAIYSDASGTLKRIVGLDTAVQGGTGTFTELDRPSPDGNDLTFKGRDSSEPAQEGIYKAVAGACCFKVADGTTSMPMGGTFVSGGFNGQPAMSDGKVVFYGEESGLAGIYIECAGSLFKVVDTNTTIPEGSGDFSGLGSQPAIHRDVVIFQGVGEFGQDGIYAADVASCGNISLSVVADATTPMPGNAGNFQFFPNSVGVHRGNVVFEASNASAKGVYVALDGAIRKVVQCSTLSDEDSDTLSGGTLSCAGEPADINREGLSARRVAFLANFIGGSQGIYVANLADSVPTSGAWSIVLLVASLIATSVLVRRRARVDS